MNLGFSLYNHIFYSSVSIGILFILLYHSIIIYLKHKNLENIEVEKQRRILLKLYESLDGKDWIRLYFIVLFLKIFCYYFFYSNTNWSSKYHIATWKGIKFNHSTHKIEKIILPRNNLGGYIHPLIGELDGLNEIDLRDNQIGGEIPQTLSNCLQLEGLYLHDNNLIGNIPDSMVNLPFLSCIYLYNNNFSGMNFIKKHYLKIK